MVFTTLAWRMVYHHFLLLKTFEVNLNHSPRTQKSPALRKSRGSSPLWSVPVRTTQNTHSGISPAEASHTSASPPASVTSGHGHHHAASSIEGSELLLAGLRASNCPICQITRHPSAVMVESPPGPGLCAMRIEIIDNS